MNEAFINTCQHCVPSFCMYTAGNYTSIYMLGFNTQVIEKHHGWESTKKYFFQIVALKQRTETLKISRGLWHCFFIKWNLWSSNWKTTTVCWILYFWYTCPLLVMWKKAWLQHPAFDAATLQHVSWPANTKPTHTEKELLAGQSWETAPHNLNQIV